jgi:predicted lipoprotein with Yx(FWY)xxD motif
VKATRGRRWSPGPAGLLAGALSITLSLAAGACGHISAAGSPVHHRLARTDQPSESTAKAANTNTSGDTRAAAPGPPVVRAARVPRYGTVLVDRRGYTLYYQPGSTAGGVGTFVCTGACTRTFKPLLLPAGLLRPTAGPGVPKPLSSVGVVVRPGGALQVAYEGRPLYSYVGDKAPGQANGLKVSGWQVVRLG